MQGTRSSAEFLAKAYESLKADNPRLTYAALARKAGFAARSYVREVLTGKKPVSVKAFPSLVTVLAISKSSAIYLKLLLALERPDFAPKGATRAELEERIRLFTEKEERRRSRRRYSNDSAPFNSLKWPIVYAALGDSTTGSRFEEIQRRCGLTALSCSRVLGEMTRQGVVRLDEKEGRYFAISPHLIFERMADEKKIQDWFVEDLISLQATAKHNFESPEHLFFDSSFSVNRSDLPALKQALWDTLLNFVDRAENASGDSVATVICGMRPVPVL